MENVKINFVAVMEMTIFRVFSTDTTPHLS